MTALIFLVAGIAMILGVRGQRAAAIGLFVLAIAASAVWLSHHMTSSLNLTL